MTCFALKLKKLISLRPFCVLIVLLELSITGLTVPSSYACCYDPPDYADTAEQAQPPTTDPSGKASQHSETVPDVPEEAQLQLYSSESSERQNSSSADTGSENSALIRRLMADGQYLRARQMAEKRLEARPFDFQLWGLLETIYSKMGLQTKPG